MGARIATLRQRQGDRAPRRGPIHTQRGVVVLSVLFWFACTNWVRAGDGTPEWLNDVTRSFDITQPTAVGSVPDGPSSADDKLRLVIHIERGGKAYFQNPAGGIVVLEKSTSDSGIDPAMLGDWVSKLLSETMRAGGAKARDEEGIATVTVLIRADASTPWSAVSRVLRTCFSPEIRIESIEFSCLDAEAKGTPPRVVKVELPIRRVRSGLEARPEGENASLVELEAKLERVGTDETMTIGSGRSEISRYRLKNEVEGAVTKSMAEVRSFIAGRDRRLSGGRASEVEIAFRGSGWTIGRVLPFFTQLRSGGRQVFLDGVSPWHPLPQMESTTVPEEH